MPADTGSFWKSKGFTDYGNYTAVPNFITKQLMMVGRGIPPHFWKFTVIAWRHWLEMELVPGTTKFVSSRKFTYTEDQLADEYSLTKENTAWCTACYRVSAFCGWEKGKRYNFTRPGTPTTLLYRNWTTEQDWIAFVAAMKLQRREDRHYHFAGTDDAFCVSLAWKVKQQRIEQGLPVDMLDAWLVKMKEAGVIKTRDDGGEYVTRIEAKPIGRREREISLEFGT